MRRIVYGIGFALLCICPIWVLAQMPHCLPQMHETVWELAAICADTARNQWCLPEQRADLAAIETIEMPTDNYAAGIMRLQANLPDTLPEHAVTMFVLGDVWLQKLPGQIQPKIQITTNHVINVRQSPSSVDWIITEMVAGQQLTAVGRNPAGDWLMVELPDGDGVGPQQDSIGWVYGGNVTPDGYVESLTVIDSPPTERPMQVFQFISAPESCADGVSSGLLLQTPPDAGWVDLQINHVSLRLNATVFLQATIPGEMIVRVLEGVVKVTAAAVPVDVPAGAELRLPLNNMGLPAESPALLAAYPHEKIAFLPVEFLPHLISTPPVLTTSQIDQLREANNPRAGVWLVKYDIPHVNCFSGQYILQYHTAEIALRLENDTLLFYEALLTRTGTGTFSGTRTYQVFSNSVSVGVSTEIYTFRVHSPTYIEAELTGIWSFTDAGNCPVKNAFQLQFLREE